MTSASLRTGRSKGVWIAWAAVLVVVVTALVIGSRGSRGPRSNADRVHAIARTVRCPVCRSESVDESPAPVSQNLRDFIATSVAEGQSDSEIRAAIEAKYPGTSPIPSATGFDALVWIVPVAATIVAAGALVLAFRRWARIAAAVPGPTDEDRALVAAALEENAHDA